VAIKIKAIIHVNLTRKIFNFFFLFNSFKICEEEFSEAKLFIKQKLINGVLLHNQVKLSA
jgi:hypothetical protein